ncbi:hypothetical protein ACSNOI_04015 [Actinomadura kijaniata]|uniref:hypothetical protein n=1 Tax=Actinomadura kijaniata TaxID=46161 RepID=UPI003F1B556D
MAHWINFVAVKIPTPIAIFLAVIFPSRCSLPSVMGLSFPWGALRQLYYRTMLAWSEFGSMITM